MKKHNFSAGPAVLPATVLDQASRAVADFNDMGLSILEISHRSAEVSAVMEEAVTLVRDLLELPPQYEVLFLTGGASSQFFMAPMNLLPAGQKAAYIDTGSWSAKAIKEAKLFGEVEVVASSKDENYTFIPKDFDLPSDARYVHITSNNTIYGTQYQEWPDTGLPFVCDMSSDIFSRPVDASRFDIIYAGAQKNLGPAGTTLVIVNTEALGKVDRPIPTMLDYRTHIAKNSAFNTPPVYAIYVSMLTLRWIKAAGGLEAMQERAEKKARLIYEEIDINPMFTGTVNREDRSRMNATFVMKKAYEDRESDFLKACREAGIVGLKGHRSVGGFRASIYNALDVESVELLVEIMKNFARKKA
ncbi:MAG: 3-phosphoserine/phosphohydroxythreonine transaminase [Saprospiraceae bacterium]|nr:3-phosphoserine/phosphohydroxythreonine transaminase [Saprospiraceae bacterium]